MNKFTAPLVVEKINETQWKIVEPFMFYIDKPGGKTVRIPAGFVTDFASVPRGLWNLFPPATGNYVQAAVVHDYLVEGNPIFEHGNPETISYSEAHNIFLQAMEVLNTPWYQRYIMYYGVKFYFSFIRKLLNNK